MRLLINAVRGLIDRNKYYTLFGAFNAVKFRRKGCTLIKQ